MIICISANPAIDRRLRVARLEHGRVNRAISAESFAGGKAAHVAMAATALGEKTVWIGFLGGATGGMIERQLTELGIEVRFVPTRSATRMNDEIIDEAGTITEMLEPGGGVTEEELARMSELCGEAFANAPTNFQAVISGSLPPNVPTSLYPDLIALARNCGGRTVLDTSGEALRAGIAASPDLIKPNADEIEAVTGVKITTAKDARDAAMELVDRGARDVAVSLGADGIVLVRGGSLEGLRGIPPRVDVVSTVGCGDAATAGFAVAGVRDLDDVEALRLAVACGSANCLAERPGQISKSVVEDLLPKVKVEAIGGLAGGGRYAN